MPYTTLMHTKCNSNQGHKLLYGLSEYFDSSSDDVDNTFFYNLVRNTPYELLFKGVHIETCIANILKYIKEGGTFETLGNGQNKIDCARFYLKVLDALCSVKEHPELEKDSFWESFALISEQAYKEIKQVDHERFLKSTLAPLVERFKSTSSFKVRASIIKGFKVIADYTIERDDFFWYCCHIFYSSCKLSTLLFELGEMPKPLEDAIEQLVDLWRIIGSKYSCAPNVCNNIVNISSELLELINYAQLPLNLGLERLSESLTSLNFHTIDFLTGEKLKRNDNIQNKLEQLGFRLIELSDEVGNIHHISNASQTLDVLLPYLWGSKDPRDRRQPDKRLSGGTLILPGWRKREFAAEIQDMCANNYRSFCVSVDGVIPNEKEIDCTCKTHEKLVLKKISLSISDRKKSLYSGKFKLKLPYDVSGMREYITMPCQLIRAKSKNNRLTMALHISNTQIKTLKPEWKAYVDQLEKVPQTQVKVAKYNR